MRVERVNGRNLLTLTRTFHLELAEGTGQLPPFEKSITDRHSETAVSAGVLRDGKKFFAKAVSCRPLLLPSLALTERGSLLMAILPSGRFLPELRDFIF